MPYEAGGRATKLGDRYEYNWIVYQLLNVLMEETYAVVMEPLGVEEPATDLIIKHKNDSREYQQCKSRNGSKEIWTASDLKNLRILPKWKRHLDRDELNTVSLVSPLSAQFLGDLRFRACNNNGDPFLFYKEQIKNASKELKQQYDLICSEFGLDVCAEDEDKARVEIKKSMSYLKRIDYKQIDKETIMTVSKSYMTVLFITDADTVFNVLFELVGNRDCFSIDLDAVFLKSFLVSKGIVFRSMTEMSFVLPKIETINRNFRSRFYPIQESLIKRSESESIIKAIEQGKSVIVTGKAGCGKSGCLQQVAEWCEKNQTLYLAIKLDERTPEDSLRRWSEKMDLPETIPYCVDSLSKEKRAVIILDQLDALRWTSHNTGAAIGICMDLIYEISSLNLERENKISLVFACRDYDYEHDRIISGIFQNTEEVKNRNVTTRDEWERIRVSELSNESVKEVVGIIYDELTNRMRDLLRIPSNLYIFIKNGLSSRLTSSKSTYDLVQSWLDIIIEKGKGVVEEESIRKTIDECVQHIDSRGKLAFSREVIHNKHAAKFLLSSGLLYENDRKLSFVHQSYYDCLLSSKMYSDILGGVDILTVIGDRENQTPLRRYNIQMLLQILIENDTELFIECGERMFSSSAVRYSFKALFYEVLRQAKELDENIQQYITSNLDNHAVFGGVVWGNRSCMDLVLHSEAGKRWDAEKMIRLISSMAPNYSDAALDYIERNLFKSENLDEEIFLCFRNGVEFDSDRMFEIRLKLLERYSAWCNRIHLYINELVPTFEMRVTRIMSLLVILNKNSKPFEHKFDDIIIGEIEGLRFDNPREVLSVLLSYVPDKTEPFSRWISMGIGSRSLERAYIQVIKAANRSLIEKSPDEFWVIYQPHMYGGGKLWTEIMLDGFCLLPSQYSSTIIAYLAKDLENRAFDNTSENEDRLASAKQVLTVHGETCDNASFSLLEDAIIHFLGSGAKRRLEERIEYNRSSKNARWFYWGGLQYELLQILPKDRLQDESVALLRVLRRRFDGMKMVFSNNHGHFGTVSTSISGKKIGINAWRGIITNKRLKNRNEYGMRDSANGFIENTIEMFSSQLWSQVSENPEEMMKMILSCRETLVEPFYRSAFSGLAHSQKLSMVDEVILVDAIRSAPCDFKSQEDADIAELIVRRADIRWPDDILDLLEKLTTEHKHPSLGDSDLLTDTDASSACMTMLNNAMYCVRGNAARAIGAIINEHPELFHRFKKAIDQIIKDPSELVRRASIWILQSALFIDENWTGNRMLRLFESDIRMVYTEKIGGILDKLYLHHKDRVITLLERMFFSEYDELVKLSCSIIVYMYFEKHELKRLLCDFNTHTDLQNQHILHAVIRMEKHEEYKEESRRIIKEYSLSHKFKSDHVASVFDNMLCSTEDIEYLNNLSKKCSGYLFVHNYIEFLQKEADSVLDYAENIICLCKNAIEETDDQGERHYFLLEHELSKLVINLYDEAVNSKIPNRKAIKSKCLDLWDLMYEHDMGTARRISSILMDR